MIPAILFGTGAGAGLWLLLTFALPTVPALGAQLAPVNKQPEPVLAVTDAAWAATWAQPLARALRAVHLPGARLEKDLRVTERGIDTHLASKALLAITGFIAPWWLQLLLALAGTPLGFEIPALACVVLAGLGFVLPDRAVHLRAARCRKEFRAALSLFLDLVWITLAGGAGIEAALLDAAEIGQGPAFAKIRAALHAAQLTRTAPWENLRRLGEELDITELAELAASISLAGTEGAKIRTSLAAKAQALRTHQITDAEADAQAATERMALPVTLLFLGFLAFIAYPAVTQVLNGL